MSSRAFEVAARCTALCWGRWLLCVVLALVFVFPAAAVEPWPEVPLPPRSDAQWIAQSMRVNGVPTQIMQFQSHEVRTTVVEYYRSYWSGGYKLPVSVRALGNATVIGQMHGPYLMTVKVEDGERNTSHGIISVAQVLGVKPDHSPGQLPMLDGAKVLKVIESDDPGIHSRQVAVLAPQSAASVSQFYTASFTNAGWRQVQNNESTRTAKTPAGSFLVFALDSSEMQISVVESKEPRGTAIMANLVTKDTGSKGN